jgi:hypothetical protein
MLFLGAAECVVSSCVFVAIIYSSVCTQGAPYGVRNGGLPVSMCGGHLSSL